MKNGILVILRPFVCDQRFYVFKDGVLDAEGFLPYDARFQQDIVNLAHANNLNTISISGPYTYAIKAHDDIIQYNNLKFEEKPLKVNVLSMKN